MPMGYSAHLANDRNWGAYRPGSLWAVS